MADKTPAWGSAEFNKAIQDHDAEADPKREEQGLKYTKKDENKTEAKPASKDRKVEKKQPKSGGKGKK